MRIEKAQQTQLLPNSTQLNMHHGLTWVETAHNMLMYQSKPIMHKKMTQHFFWPPVPISNRKVLNPSHFSGERNLQLFSHTFGAHMAQAATCCLLLPGG